MEEAVESVVLFVVVPEVVVLFVEGVLQGVEVTFRGDVVVVVEVSGAEGDIRQFVLHLVLF